MIILRTNFSAQLETYPYATLNNTIEHQYKPSSCIKIYLPNWFKHYFYELKTRRVMRNELLDNISQPKLVRECETAYNNYINGEDNLPQGITLSNLNEFDSERASDINFHHLLSSKGPVRGFSNIALIIIKLHGEIAYSFSLTNAIIFTLYGITSQMTSMFI